MIPTAHAWYQSSYEQVFLILTFYSDTGHFGIRLTETKFVDRIYCNSRTANDVDRAAIKLLKFVEAKKREREQIALGFDIEWKPTFRRR